MATQKQKEYNTIEDLLEYLKSNYTESAYCHIFSIVSDEEWEELELSTEKLIKEKGELLDDLHDIRFDDDGCSTSEFRETINYGVQF